MPGRSSPTDRWRLPVCGGSDAHDARYVGSGLTRFEGRDARALRRALVAGRTHAHLNWSWTLARLPAHLKRKCADALRYLSLAQRRPRARVTETLS